MTSNRSLKDQKRRGLLINEDAARFAVFITVAILPAIAANFTSLPPEIRHAQLYSFWGFIQQLLGSLQFGLLAAYMLSQGGLLPKDARIVARDIPIYQQVLAGVGIWFGYYLFFDFWSVLASLAHIKSPSLAWFRSTTPDQEALNAVFSFVNGISEEVMRVYLLTQIQRFGAGRKATVVAAAVLISSYHVYQGWFTAIAFLLANLFLNRYYLSTRSLLSLFIWHALADFSHSTTSLPGWELVSALVNGTIGAAAVYLFSLIGVKL